MPRTEMHAPPERGSRLLEVHGAARETSDGSAGAALNPKVIAFLKNTCVFCQPWWLEAVSPGCWDIAAVERGGAIVAVLPYTYKVRLRRFLLLEMPLLTPYLGPWLLPVSTTYASKALSWENELLTELIANLPHYAAFSHRCHPLLVNWLPFYWRKYSQTTHYTYIIEDLTDPERVLASFSHAKKKNIRRARRIVEVRQDLPAKDFYGHLVMTLAKKHRRVLYSFHFFQRFYDACCREGAGKVFYAIDGEGHVHAAIFVASDQRSAYYLISSIDPEFSASGAVSLLVHEAIKYYSGRTRSFDFCGHMRESIERSSREFGGRQTPHFVISRTESVTVRAYRALWQLTQQGSTTDR